jgi:YidC/Oxa1 family membrane protein insertase
MIIFVAIAFAFMSVYQQYFVQPQSVAASQARQGEQEGKSASDPNAAPIASASPNTAAQPPASSQPTDRVIAVVTTAIGELKIDELGRVAQATLSGSVFKGENSEQTALFNQRNARALEIRFTDKPVNTQAFNTAYVASASEIDASAASADLTLTQTLNESNLTIVKELRFYPDGHYDFSVKLSRATEYFVTTGFRPDAASDPMTIQGALVHTSSGAIETIEEGEAIEGQSFKNARMVSAFDRYYATLFFNYETPFNVVVSRVGDGAPLAFVKPLDGADFAASGYIGPKYVDKLRAINPELTAAVEYGFFTFLSKPLFVALEWIYSLVPNWGWAIVIFTILVKIVLFPLSHKGMVSMSKLKDLAPKMKELQERYKDDKQKLQTHMMELYKKHGANPLGGCLPLLLQIPIFFAIYRVLLNAIELKGAEWLYIGDLSMKDPFFVLPLLMGATMWFQQRITPSNFTDPMQAKLFRWLPVVFTVFFLFFPAGLVLYWLVNNIISIGQQWFVNKSVQAAKEINKSDSNNEKN